MKVKRRIVSGLLFIVLLTSLIGCTKEKSTVNGISPFDKKEIKIMTINCGNSAMKEITDKELIDTFIDHLNSIRFNKIDKKQEEEIFDGGKIFNLDTTYAIQLSEYQMGIPKADVVVISDTELILADSETMRNSRTVCYRNQSDEASLNAVKKIYSLAKDSMN